MAPTQMSRWIWMRASGCTLNKRGSSSGGECRSYRLAFSKRLNNNCPKPLALQYRIPERAYIPSIHSEYTFRTWPGTVGIPAWRDATWCHFPNSRMQKNVRLVPGLACSALASTGGSMAGLLSGLLFGLLFDLGCLSLQGHQGPGMPPSGLFRSRD